MRPYDVQQRMTPGAREPTDDGPDDGQVSDPGKRRRDIEFLHRRRGRAAIPGARGQRTGRTRRPAGDRFASAPRPGGRRRGDHNGGFRHAVTLSERKARERQGVLHRRQSFAKRCHLGAGHEEVRASSCCNDSSQRGSGNEQERRDPRDRHPRLPSCHVERTGSRARRWRHQQDSPRPQRHRYATGATNIARRTGGWVRWVRWGRGRSPGSPDGDDVRSPGCRGGSARRN